MCQEVCNHFFHRGGEKINLLDFYYKHSGEIVTLQVDEILEINRQYSGSGLYLTRQDALELINCRNQSLSNLGRIDLGFEVIKNLIKVFSKSPYINPGNYAATLNELVEIFYYLKNETEDRISDAKLMEIMKDFFDKSSRGSLELLKDRDLAVFARLFRYYLSASQTY